VQVLRTRGRVFSEEIRRGVLGFFFVYAMVAVLGVIALTATGLDLTSAASGVTATLNVVGPGIGELGATDNYEAAARQASSLTSRACDLRLPDARRPARGLHRARAAHAGLLAP
jgi:Trk-type K+ transport system membrane component